MLKRLKKLKKLWIATKEVDEEKIRVQAKKDGSYNLRDYGLAKAKLGLTSIEEVLGSTSDE